MDEKTKRIVASHLTLACLTKKMKQEGVSSEPVSIFEYYRHFLKMLEEDQETAQYYQLQEEKRGKKLAL
jgi:phospholipid N-methyltransferase